MFRSAFIGSISFSTINDVNTVIVEWKSGILIEGTTLRSILHTLKTRTFVHPRKIISHWTEWGGVRTEPANRSFSIEGNMMEAVLTSQEDNGIDWPIIIDRRYRLSFSRWGLHLRRTHFAARKQHQQPIDIDRL